MKSCRDMRTAHGASILDNVTRESVESTLVKSGNTLVRRSSVSGSSLDEQV